MRPYEVMVILDSSVEDAAVNSTVDRITELVTARKGTVGQVEKWGRRRFAYEMKHKWEGYYTLIELNAEREAVAEVDRVLTLQDDVLRHKIMRIPESVAGRSRSTSTPEPVAAGAAAETTGAK